MPEKHITFTPAAADGVSYVFVVDEKDFEEKKHQYQQAGNEFTKVPIQEYKMFKTTAQDTSMVPCPEMEVLKTFGSINGNQILEFLFTNGNMNGKVAM